MARKQITPVFTSRDQVDSALAELCRLQAEKNKTEGSMNAQLTAVRERFQPTLDRVSLAAMAMECQIEQWAIANRPAEFGDKKSLDLLHGTLSFRTAGPKCSLLGRMWTWESVLDALKKRLAGFVRVVSEVNKDAILAAYAANETSDAALAECGIKVTQRETFGLSLHYEESADAPAVQTGTPAADVRRAG